MEALERKSEEYLDFGYRVCEKIFGTITNKIHNEFLSASEGGKGGNFRSKSCGCNFLVKLAIGSV